MVNKSINNSKKWFKPLILQLQLANNNITRKFDILFLNQYKSHIGTMHTKWKNILSPLWIEIFRIRNKLPIKINWNKLNNINMVNLYNYQPIWNKIFLTLANSNSTTLIQSTSKNTQETVYKIVRKKYSFPDIQTKNHKFISIEYL